MNKKYLFLSLISIMILLTLTAVCAEENTTEMQSVNDDSSLNVEINDILETGSSSSTSDSSSSSTSESSSSSTTESGYIVYDDDNNFYDNEDDYYDNNEDDYYNDDETSEYSGEFIVENITQKYDGWGSEITVWLQDNDENPLIWGDDVVTLHWSDGTKTKLYDNDEYSLEELADEINYGHVDNEVYYYWLNDDSYDWKGYSAFITKPVGTYTVTAVCDSYYNIKPATFTVKITKGTVKLTPKVYHSASGDYATLKCIVKDSYGQGVEEGTVTFKINGHSYKVKVKNGVATKKVKLTKAKTYKYTATFSGDNYISKSASSKVYVYKTTKKARTFKIGKYKIVVPLAKYKKLINAKNTNKMIGYTLYTGKKITQKVKMGNKWKTKKNVKVYMDINYGGKTGGQCGVPNKYSIFLSTYYQSPGYDDCKPCLYGFKSRALISSF